MLVRILRWMYRVLRISCTRILSQPNDYFFFTFLEGPIMVANIMKVFNNFYLRLKEHINMYLHQNFNLKLLTLRHFFNSVMLNFSFSHYYYNQCYIINYLIKLTYSIIFYLIACVLVAYKTHCLKECRSLSI